MGEPLRPTASLEEEMPFIVEDDASRWLAENPPRSFDEEMQASLERQRNEAHPIYCSFCGRRQDEVFCMIAGPTVFICDECVELCVAVIAGRKTEDAVEAPDQAERSEGGSP